MGQPDAWRMIRRRAAAAGIAEAIGCHTFRATGNHRHFVDAADPEEGMRKLLTIVQERIPKRFGFDPIRDIQVLCPMNRGGLGARSLNVELQKELNRPARSASSASDAVRASPDFAEGIAAFREKRTPRYE
jgi:ATP-dependent exoDNAse (exonuclease V) alpha subunit